LLYCDICVPFLTAVAQAVHGVESVPRRISTLIPDTSAPVPKYLETLRHHHPSKMHMIWAIVSSE